MRYFYLLLLIFSIGFTFSCNQPSLPKNDLAESSAKDLLALDSLKVILSENKKSDTTRLNILVSIIVRYASEGEKEEMIPFVEEALELADKLESSDSEIKTRVNFNIGLAYKGKGDAKSALLYFEKALGLLKKGKDEKKYLDDAYNQLSDVYGLLEENDKMLTYLDSAIYYAKKYDNLALLGTAKVKEGVILRKRGEPEQSIVLIKEGEAYLKQLGDEKKLSKVYNALGRSYRQISEYDSAMYYYKNNLRLDEKYGDVISASKVHNNIGNIQQDLGEYDKALESYVNSLKLKEEIGNKRSISIAYHNIGAVRKDLKDFDLALLDFEKSMDLAKEVDFKLVIIHNYLKIGNVYRDIGKVEEAVVEHEKALELSEAIDFKIGLVEAYTSLGKDYAELKNYYKSLDYSFTGLEIAEKIKNKSNKAILAIDIAKVYMQLENSPNRKELFSKINKSDADIELLLLKGYEISKEIADVKNLMTSLVALKTFYKNKNDTGNELAFSREYIELRDSLFNEERADAIADYETQYETGEKVKEITLLEKENQLVEREKALLATRNNYYLGIAGMLLSFLLIGSYLFLQLRKSKRKIESQNNELQNLNATKDKFFGIIAHDIRSPIVALDGVGEQMEYFIEKDKKDRLVRLASRVDSTAKRLSSLLDNLLNWALLQQGVIPYHPKKLNVSEVVQSITDMFQNNADSKGVELSSDINPNLEIMADESALQTILRNLVSNAIKFTPKDGTVSIVSELKNDTVFLYVKDSGTGIAKETVDKLFTLQKKSKKGTAGEKGTGLGLNLVKELVELNKGKINVVSELGKGSQFSVELPRG